MLDRSPIVVVATLASSNTKTGAMLQTWILSDVLDPLKANRTGADKGICGSCAFRGNPTDRDNGTASERTCYIQIGQAPLGIWRKVQRDGYEVCADLAALGAGETVRMGSYGDPAAVPTNIWKALLSRADGWTGYTHQINSVPSRRRDSIASLCMVSADTLEGARKSWGQGRRTFRVISDASEITDGERMCPATKEGGQKTTCIRCKLCRGSSIDAPSIVAVAHGSGKKHAANIIGVSA